MRRLNTTIIIGLASIFISAAAVAGRGGKPRKTTVIDGIGQRVSEAFKKGNTEKLMSLYADHFMSNEAPTKDNLKKKMAALFSRYFDLRLTRSRVGSVQVSPPYAYEIVNEILVAKAVAPPEKLTTTKKKLIAYENCGGRWLITGEEEIDVDGEKKIRKQVYDDPEKGFSLKAPDNWNMHVIKSRPMSLLVISSPDMRSSLSIGRARVPVRMSVKQVLDEDIAATMKLPGTEIIERGPITIAGIDGHQITSDVKLNGRVPRVRRAYFASGRNLLFVIASAESGAVFEAAEEKFNSILDSLRLADPRRDPSLGIVEKGLYKNNKYKCWFALPSGWEADVAKGPGEFKVSFASGDGIVEGELVCVRTRRDVSEELLVMTDEYETRRIGVDYELIRRGEVSCANKDGYGTLSRFKLAGRSCVRRRVYFLSGRFMYCLIINTRPSDKYNEKSSEIGSLVRSVRLGSPLR